MCARDVEYINPVLSVTMHEAMSPVPLGFMITAVSSGALQNRSTRWWTAKRMTLNRVNTDTKASIIERLAGNGRRYTVLYCFAGCHQSRA